MRKFLGVSLVFLVVASMSSIGLLLAAEPTKMPIEAAPSVQQFSPPPPPAAAPAPLPPARYPIFTPSGDNQACINYLNGLSNQLIGSADPQATLLTATVNIDAKYRKTGRVLVTWTMRVVGVPPPAYPIWPGLCKNRGYSWHGTVNQYFGEGNAYSALYVGSNQFKEIAMTIPAGAPGSVTTVTTVNDPTHTGSVLIQPSDFTTKMLPPTLNLILRWRNDTSMRLHTDKNFINLIVTITRD